MILILRRAGAGDLALLERECAPDFFARSPHLARPNPAKLRAWLAAVLEADVVVIAERGGIYLGSMALSLVAFPWSDEIAVIDRWTHARADRPSRALAELVRFGRLWASRCGAGLYVGDLGATRTAARARLWGSLGGECAGVTWRFH